MKRKARIIIATLATAVILASCGTKERTASAKATSTGKQVISTLDGYLDGDISYEEANEKISDLYEDMAYVSDQDTSDEHHIKDAAIRTHISAIDTGLTYDNFKNDSDSFDRLVDARNKLAEDLGEKER